MKSNLLKIKTMKKFILTLAAVLVMGTLGMHAQEEQKNDQQKNQKQRPTEEEMLRMQGNRVANELMLDDITTSKFIPLYKNYLKELKECYKINREDKKNVQQDKARRREMTDADVEKMITDYFNNSRKVLDIKENYFKKFREFLSAKQIQKMYMSSMMMGGGRFMLEPGQGKIGQKNIRGWKNNGKYKMKRGHGPRELNPNASMRHNPPMTAGA